MLRISNQVAPMSISGKGIKIYSYFYSMILNELSANDRYVLVAITSEFCSELMIDQLARWHSIKYL